MGRPRQVFFMNTEYLNYFFTKTNFTAMQAQTNTTTQNLTDAELITITGGEGYAPKSGPTDSTQGQTPEETFKIVLFPTYY